MTSIELHELHYTKTDLAKVPERDRTFFLMATSLANDLQIFYKSFALAVADDRDELIIKQGNSAVGLLMLRNLAGRIWEGQNLLEREYKRIEAQYEEQLSPRSSDALSKLRGYFKQKRNLIQMVRHKIGFHADAEIVRSAFERLPDDADMGDYFSDTIGNTLYYSAEMLHYEAINGFTGLGDQRSSLQKVVVDVRTLTLWFNEFVFGFVRVFLERHLNKQYRQMWDRPTTLNGLSNFEDLGIPYFMILPKSGSQ